MCDFRQVSGLLCGQFSQPQININNAVTTVTGTWQILNNDLLEVSGLALKRVTSQRQQMDRCK